MAPKRKRKYDVRLRRGGFIRAPRAAAVALRPMLPALGVRVSPASVGIYLGNYQITGVEVVSPDPFVIAVDGTQQIDVEVTATRYAPDADGLGDVAKETFTLAAVDAGVTYVSDADGIATVSATGLITGIAEGGCTITVKAGGITDLIAVTVNDAPTAASVEVSPSTNGTGVGGTAQFAAVVRDSGGQQMLGQTVTWESDATGVATVGADSGTEDHQVTATGVSPGDAGITATSGAITSAPSILTISALSGTLYFADKFDGGVKHSGGGWSWQTQNPTVQLLPDAPGSLDTTYGLRFRYLNTTQEQRFIMGENLTGYYVGFYIRYPANYFHRDGPSSDNNKFFRTWSGDPADGNSGYTNYSVKGGFSTRPSPSTGGGSILENEYGYSTTSCTPLGMTWAGSTSPLVFPSATAAWYKIVLRFQLSSAIGVSDGTLQAWINDVLRVSNTTRPWYTRCTAGGGESTMYLNRGYLLGASNSGWNEQQDVYISRVRFASTKELADPDLTTGW